VGTITIYLFVTRGISIPKIIIPAGLGGLIIGLLCTVPLDSYFWQSFPLWPEWSAFYYNTIQGHSADWGISPWHFYFSNALPRLMLNPLTYLLCIPLALLNPTTRRLSFDILTPLLAFGTIYSFLPHKEWRFIIYIVPGLTAVAGAGASWIFVRRSKSAFYGIVSLALVGSVILSFAASAAILAISSLNYPGGTALQVLHNQIPHPPNTHFSVHFDNLACQTGVSRFLERHEGPQTILDVLEAQEVMRERTWTYDKSEDPEKLLDPVFWAQFDYVLAERPEKVIGSWDIVGVIHGFGGVNVRRPGDNSSGETGKTPVIGVNGIGEKISRMWTTLEGLVRASFLRGWWMEIRMVPKIYILTNQLKRGSGG
jgi:alpha-1,6-mannosyltransferase